MGGRVVILGPGLLGGSLALALAQQRPVVWGRRRAPLDFLAQASSQISVEPEMATAVKDAELVILATPIGVMPQLLDELVRLQTLAPGAIITDVGSVKRPIVQQATEILKGTGYRFVGSHPMAGSEAAGVEAARADLFENAMCLLTPNSDTSSDALSQTEAFWKALGCRIHIVCPTEHDQIVAHISHMPHALASIIVDTALGKKPAWAEFAGGGLRDTTRVASGDPGMWAEILLENRDSVVDALRQAETRLQDLLKFLDSREIEPIRRFLLEAKELRDTHIARTDTKDATHST
jgi:prephenate dehydrogenase